MTVRFAADKCWTGPCKRNIGICLVRVALSLGKVCRKKHNMPKRLVLPAFSGKVVVSIILKDAAGEFQKVSTKGQTITDRLVEEEHLSLSHMRENGRQLRRGNRTDVSALKGSTIPFRSHTQHVD